MLSVVRRVVKLTLHGSALRWVSRQYDALHSDAQWSNAVQMLNDLLWPNGKCMEPWDARTV